MSIWHTGCAICTPFAIFPFAAKHGSQLSSPPYHKLAMWHSPANPTPLAFRALEYRRLDVRALGLARLFLPWNKCNYLEGQHRKHRPDLVRYKYV